MPMFRSVYRTTLWEQRTSTVWWFFAALVLSIWLVAFYPTVRDSVELRQFFDNFPVELLAMLGVDPAIYTTGFGYLQGQLYSLIGPLLVLAFTIGAGAAATAREEEDGTIDLLLGGNPLRRRVLLLQKFGALVTLSAALVAVLALVLILANPIVDLRLSIGGILGMNLGLLLLGVFFGSLAMAVGAWRGRRSHAIAVAASLAIGSWFVNAFAPLIGWLDTLNTYLPFHWYLADDPLLDGPTPWHGMLVVSSAVLVGVALALFQRRNVRSWQLLRPPRRRSEPGGPLESGESGASGVPTTGRRRGRLDWMLGSVYGKTLWDKRRSIWGWILGLGLLATLTAAFWPTVQRTGDTMQGLVDALPAELLAMFGITDASSLTTPEGYMSARLFTGVGAISMLVFTIGMGASTLAGEERRGTIDLLMGNPTRRRRVARDKFAGMVTLAVAVVAALGAVVFVAGSAYDMGLGFVATAAASFGLALLALFFGALAFAVGAASGRPSLAVGIAAGLAGAAFILNGFGSIVDELAPARWLSPFFWYLRDTPPLARGFSGSYWLLVIGIVLFGLLAIPAFRRRDLGT
jgi:ABC-2 type transport system permease protein